MNDKDFYVACLKPPLKFIMPLGMLSSVTFFIMVVLGQTLWADYSPITNFISELTADGAPNHATMRIISNISYIFLILFTAGMTVLSFIKHLPTLRFGYGLLFLTSLISIVGFDMFPMTIDHPFGDQNALHIIITAIIILITVIAAFTISFGCLKCDKLKKLGLASMTLTILFTVFNIVLLFAMLQQSSTMGLIQRLGIFTFYVYIFILSCVYTLKLTKNTPKPFSF